MTTRRDFLGAATTALSQFRVSGANERIRVGIIGAGERGAYHAERLQRHGDAEVVSICDVYRMRAETAAERSNPRATVVKDYRRLLDRNDIDAVVVSVSDHNHTPILLNSLDAGKDVYLEKPMTYRIEEGRQIVTAVKRTGRVVQVGTQQK